VTTREKIHQLVDALPEADLDPVAEILVSRETNGTVDTTDEWGELGTQLDGAAGDLMTRLDKEEIAEFGETISQAWGYESPK
jgi:hypothetical protein